MDQQQLKFIKINADAIMKTLSSSRNDSKTTHVTLQMADNFNRLIDDTVKIAPQLQSALPAKISKTGRFAIAGVTDSKYLDLEIYLNQLIDLLAAIEG